MSSYISVQEKGLEMKVYSLVLVFLVFITSTQRVYADATSSCLLSYREAASTLDRMVSTAKLITMNGGITSVVVQSSLGSVGLLTLGGVITGGGAIVGGLTTVALLKKRIKSLKSVLNVYQASVEGNLKKLEPLVDKLDKKFGINTDSTQVASQIRSLIVSGYACRMNRSGEFKPVSHQKFIKKLAKEMRS